MHNLQDCMLVPVQVCTFAGVVCVCVYMSVSMCMFRCMCTCMYVCMQVGRYVCIVHVCVCVCTSVYVP